MSRRGVLAALVAPGVVALPRLARAVEITWRIGHNAPADFPLHIRLMEAAGVIATRSGGRMVVEVHPDGELGSPVGLLGQVRAGTVDAVPVSGQLLSHDLAVAALPTAGFAFSGYDHLWPAIDGDVGRTIRGLTTERLGLVAMDTCWDLGFRQITTSGRRVGAAADMEGLRLRTPPETDFVALFQGLKALPVAMPLTALAQALRRGAIDGQEGVLPLVQAAGLYQEQSVCALTNHVWDGQWLCVSGGSWSRLPAPLKDIVAAAFNESGLRQRQDVADRDVKVRAELEAEGIKFNTVDAGSFRAVLREAGYYDGWRKRMGDEAWATLEKYTGRLA